MGAGVLMLSTIALHGPPAFNAMWLDRALVLEGVSQDFWAKIIREHGGKKPLIVSSLGKPSLVLALPAVPFSLLGNYDYACLLGVVNVSGYSPTAPKTRFTSEVSPLHNGVFTYPDAEILRAEHPEVLHISVRNVNPTILTLQEGTSTRAFVLDQRALQVKEIAVPPNLLPSPDPVKPSPTSTPAPAPKSQP